MKYVVVRTDSEREIVVVGKSSSKDEARTTKKVKNEMILSDKLTPAQSKNYKLKIKLLIIYYLNFKWYYRLFVR